MSAAHEYDLPLKDLRLSVSRGGEALRQQLSAWQRLVAVALEPNVFLEPFFLLPALEHLGGEDVEVVTVDAPPASGSPTQRVLCGLFLVRKGKRLSAGDGLWKHSYAYVGSPLVRRDVARETIALFFDWLEERAGSALFTWNRIRADGPFFVEFWSEVQRRGCDHWIQEQILRALFVPAASSEEFQERAIQKKLRKELTRTRRRLSEGGALAAAALAPDADGDALRRWLDDFIRLEDSGWKGRAGSAFARLPEHERFMRAVLTGAHEQGQLAMLRLDFEGQPMAMNTALLTGEGGFYFKIAHEETLSRFSPGLQLELDFLEHLHGRPGVRWVDSCAAPAHPMIDRLWDARRLVQTVHVATRAGRGRIPLSLLPIARAARRAWRGGGPQPPRNENSEGSIGPRTAAARNGTKK